ncbi:nucleoside phosphorylase domain-containing protein [Xylariaceae sp. FL0255]|nr:nucleoside phosphorylase domain-containing protein [Xylariaceae sp. FL0255]
MATPKQKTRSDYSVAIFCAMDLERNAVRYMLDNEHKRLPAVEGDSNSYIVGDLHGHNVVLACLPGQQGKGAAATVATNTSRSFPSIKWRIFVGIGGGVPSVHNDIRLGDVVISMPEGQHGGVVQYDLGKETTNSVFELKGFLWPPPPRLRNAAQDMHSDHLVQDNKAEEYLQAMLRKGRRLAIYHKPSEPDVLFEESYHHPQGAGVCAGHCDLSRIINRPAREEPGPEFHYGLIASGDRVIKNAEIRDYIAREAGRDVLCFEMEAAGLLTEFSSIVIRGISDYADSHKNSSWQHYAAATAAACTKELLSYVDPEVVVVEPAPGSPGSPGSLSAPKSTRGGNVFTGQGVQNIGGGNVSIGRDFRINR